MEPASEHHRSLRITSKWQNRKRRAVGSKDPAAFLQRLLHRNSFSSGEKTHIPASPPGNPHVRTKPDNKNIRFFRRTETFRLEISNSTETFYIVPRTVSLCRQKYFFWRKLKQFCRKLLRFLRNFRKLGRNRNSFAGNCYGSCETLENLAGTETIFPEIVTDSSKV
jgi:hypothetical protein